MATRTRIEILMHPKEYRRERSGTGRMASLHLAESEIIPGVMLDGHPRVRALLDERSIYPALLYPGPLSLDLSSPEGRERLAREAGGRRLAVFLVDATWSCAKAVLRGSPRIAALPRLGISPSEKSRWIIKRQPRPECLSTIEAIHELLIALEEAGLERYPDKKRLLAAFAAMQDYQVSRAEEAGRRGNSAARYRPPRDTASPGSIT